jgi:hypothetical protein
MFGGNLFKKAWNKASDAAKKSAAALATGAEIVSKYAAKTVRKAKQTAYDTAKWVNQAVKWAAIKAYQGVQKAKDIIKGAFKKAKEITSNVLIGAIQVTCNIANTMKNTAIPEPVDPPPASKKKDKDKREIKSITIDEENQVPPEVSDEGYINICSSYRDFSDIGVGYSLTITDADGNVIEELDEVRLPIGTDPCVQYGPYPPGPKNISLTPLLNHNKQNEDGGDDWIQEIEVIGGGEVEAQFFFVETDTWDSRYTTARINQLDNDQRQRFLVFINKTEEDTGHQFRVADGLRTDAQQDVLYCNSRAADRYCRDRGLINGNGNWRSNAKAGESYHNYGLAVDIYRFGENNELINPDSTTEIVAIALELTWGNSFGDPPHFEYSVQPFQGITKE